MVINRDRRVTFVLLRIAFLRFHARITGGQREVAFIKMGFAAAAAACYLYLCALGGYEHLRHGVTSCLSAQRKPRSDETLCDCLVIHVTYLAILVTFKCKKIKRARDAALRGRDVCIGDERSFLSLAYVTLVSYSACQQTGADFRVTFRAYMIPARRTNYFSYSEGSIAKITAF